MNYGPGYRVYYQQRGLNMIILYAGANNSTQARDIEDAPALARTFKEED